MKKVPITEAPIIVTGGAGLIGSALIWALNKRKRKNILVVDVLDTEEKRHNMAPLKYHSVVGISEFRKALAAGMYDHDGIEAVFHLGACSSTTERDWAYLLDNNVEFSKEIITWCANHHARCVYASSAATYGDGSAGYSDDHALLDTLAPLNLYGESKLEVDRWARDTGYLSSAVGLRYFNVFGPNEYHKGDMRSVVAKKYEDVAQKGFIELFKSYRPDYGSGEQKRDFIYVKDAVEMTLFFLDASEVNGLFNIGAGVARSWNDLARAMFVAIGRELDIRYIDMPETLRPHYQYFTEADVSKLRAAGWAGPSTSLEDAVAEYVRDYLAPHRHLGE